MLNGEKYKEICPDNTLLSNPHLRSCVISHHQKALLKREGGSDEQLRCFLQLEGGQGPLSDLQVGALLPAARGGAGAAVRPAGGCVASCSSRGGRGRCPTCR